MSIIEDLGVDWSVFVESEQELIKEAVAAGHYEHLAAIVTQLNPEKIVEIEKMQRQLRPKAFTFDSEVQKEFEIWMSQTTPANLTPEAIEEWQAKIDAEKAQKLAQLTGEKIQADVNSLGGTNATTVTVSNMLAELKGLGAASVEKLRSINIQTIEDFKAMPFEKKKEVLGPVVAANFKDFNSINV